LPHVRGDRLLGERGAQPRQMVAVTSDDTDVGVVALVAGARHREPQQRHRDLTVRRRPYGLRLQRRRIEPAHDRHRYRPRVAVEVHTGRDQRFRHEA